MNKNLGKIIKQSKYWMIAASVLPLTALSGLFFLQFIGWNTNLEKIVTLTATTMFFIATVWWWWAVNKIVEFANMMEKTEKNLQEVTKNILDIKIELK